MMRYSRSTLWAVCPGGKVSEESLDAGSSMQRALESSWPGGFFLRTYFAPVWSVSW